METTIFCIVPTLFIFVERFKLTTLPHRTTLSPKYLICFGHTNVLLHVNRRVDHLLALRISTTRSALMCSSVFHIYFSLSVVHHDKACDDSSSSPINCTSLQLLLWTSALPLVNYWSLSALLILFWTTFRILLSFFAISLSFCLSIGPHPNSLLSLKMNSSRAMAERSHLQPLLYYVAGEHGSVRSIPATDRTNGSSEYASKMDVSSLSRPSLANSLSSSSSLACLNPSKHARMTCSPDYAGLHDPEPTDWQSLLVIYILTVVAEAARGLLLPSTWPYFKSLGGSNGMLGVLIASYSFGRMFSTTPLGYLSDHLSSAKVMCGASFLQAFGHLLYAVAPSVPVLYIARAIVGFGSATTSVARAHITKAVPQKHRTHHFAYLSGLQFVGIAVLPVLGGVMSLLPSFSALSVRMNGYTYPAWLLVFANLGCIDLINRFYKDPPEITPGSPISVTSPASSMDGAILHSTSPDIFAIVMCLLINLVFRGVLAELETVTIPFFMEQFQISYGLGSVCLSLIGCLGVCMCFSFKPIASRFSDRSLVAAGLCFIALGCIPLSISFLVDRMNLFTYAIFLAFTWSVAYPLGQTAILSLYSKLLTGLHVGGLIGLFSTSGAVSPLVLSVVASKLWDDYGRESVFMFIIAIVLIAMILMVGSYRRLVPPALPFQEPENGRIADR